MERTKMAGLADRMLTGDSRGDQQGLHRRLRAKATMHVGLDSDWYFFFLCSPHGQIGGGI